MVQFTPDGARGPSQAKEYLNMNRASFFAAAVSIFTFLSGEAFAHVSLEGKTVQAGASFDATFRVGHGCAGSPTVKLNIRIPNGVVAVEPQAKEGWSVTSESGTLDHATVSGGQSFSDGVRMVTWSGLLSPHQVGTFTLRARLADNAVAGQKVTFLVYQQCEKGEERWIDPDDEDDHPAPFLTIVPKRSEFSFSFSLSRCFRSGLTGLLHMQHLSRRSRPTELS